MSDIADFILARVAEDERAALECARLFPPPWEIADRGWRVRIYSAAVPLSEDVGDPGDERVPCVIEVEPTYAHDGWLSDNVEHIARHDPARALARCAADRRIVEQHAPVNNSTIPREVPRWECHTCASGDPREGYYPHDFPCDTLRALASIYADHPDYRQEWK